MSSVNTTQIDGDVSVGRNVSAGGDATIQGGALVKGNLVVEGWLEAPNMKKEALGLFATEEKLKENYPEPRPGQYAYVGNTFPAYLYIEEDGQWKNTGNQIGSPEIPDYDYTEFERKLNNEITERTSSDTKLLNLIKGEPTEIENNIRNAFTFLGSFSTWKEAIVELDNLYYQGVNNKKIGHFRFLLNGRNIDVINWVQSWENAIFTQTIQGSIKWSDEAQEMLQDLKINTYGRVYNNNEWTSWVNNEIVEATEKTSGLLSNNDKKKINSLPKSFMSFNIDEIINDEGVYFTNTTYNFNEKSNRYELDEKASVAKVLIPTASKSSPGIISIEIYKRLNSMPKTIISDIVFSQGESYVEIEITGEELNGHESYPNEYSPFGNTYKISTVTNENAGLMSPTDKNKLDLLKSLTYVDHGTSDTSIRINAFEYHRWGIIPSLVINIPNEPVTNGIINVYMFEFVSGSVATKIALPTHIKTSPYTIETNKVYRVTVINNLATIKSFG